MQLLSGMVVKATVTEVGPWGFYLIYGDARILVLIPEVSWTDSVRDCRDFAATGDDVEVRILRFVPTEQVYIASVKKAHSAEDPWRDISHLIGKQEARGVVRQLIHKTDSQDTFGYIIDLGKGLVGMLLVGDSLGPHVVGDMITVVAREIDQARRNIELAERVGRP